MTRQNNLLTRARSRIPGGVNSPVRAFNGVGGDPVFFDHAKGACLYDVDGKTYIDYVGSWGPMIAGHSHPRIVEAVRKAIEKGLSFGAPCEGEVILAEKVCEMVPGLDMVRMVNSGTEATMSAIRLARAATGRDKILKFEGCYHGHADSFLVKAGSGALTLGVPTSPGVPAALADLTLTVPYNDLAAVEQCFDEHGDSIAAIIVEPVAGNMNCIPPVDGFLDGLRQCSDRHDSVLIFDEVMTGFRVARGGATALFGVRPDLYTFGKVIGGGMPVGAFGGKQDLMEQIAPTGPVYQAGTLSGNPVAMAAGLASLEIISETGFFYHLARQTRKLTQGLEDAAADAGVAVRTNAVGGMFGLFFTDQESITNFDEVSRCDIDAFRVFFHQMLDRGVYLAPSAYEAGFVSAAHTDEHIEATVAAARESFARL